MNNNYHTQVDSTNRSNNSNGMLNEIAANRHLLQQPFSLRGGQQAPVAPVAPEATRQQMQNFPGTPINNNINNTNISNPNNTNNATCIANNNKNSQINNQLMQQLTAQQQQELLYAQQLAQQVQQNQLYQQQQQLNNQQPYPLQPANNDIELELSESKPEPIKQLIQPQITLPIVSMSSSNQTAPVTSAVTTINPEQLVNKSAPLQHQQQQQQQQYQQRRHHYAMPMHTKPASKSNSSTVTTYVIIPIVLVIVFVFLIHPKSSAFLAKYLPKIDTKKGILVRSAILVIAYLIVSFIARPKS